MQQSLRQTARRYQGHIQQPQGETTVRQRQATIKTGIEQLTALANRLQQPTLTIAVFGLVSRGKSAVINALLGQPVLQTGPLHGVTRWPRSVYWSPPVETVHSTNLPMQIELIDTPGLDEIDGQDRADMAETIASQADLILFVVSGDITRTEYQALTMLQASHKPILLVFNKTDLYPEMDRQAVYDALQRLWQQSQAEAPLALGPEQVVMVAAEPAPLQVRVEWPDGHISHEWEAPPPQIAPLRQAILTLVQHHGPALIALNALGQAQALETKMVATTMTLHQSAAEQLIWQFAKYKALAVALNPIAVLDVLGGVMSDLILIRSLARLYGLPMTNYEAGRLWQAIVRSGGAMLFSELGSGLLLGMGKSAAAVTSVFDSSAGLAAWAGAMVAQASAAGYGTYAVGKATQQYLERGGSWGPEGIRQTLQELLHQLDDDATTEHLRQELQSMLD